MVVKGNSHAILTDKGILFSRTVCFVALQIINFYSDQNTPFHNYWMFANFEANTELVYLRRTVNSF